MMAPEAPGRAVPLLLQVALLGAVLVCAPGCGKVEARALAKEGNSLYRGGKLRQALAKYERAVEIDPKFALAHLHLGYACVGLLADEGSSKTQRYVRRAERAFGRFIALRPDDERGPKFYLQVLVDGGRFDEALTFLRRQHRQRPRDLKVVASLGLVSSKAGRFAEALKWYERRASLLPREAQARYLIGTACWEHLHDNAQVTAAERQRIANRGIKALEDAVGLRSRYVEALTYINLLYRERALAHPAGGARERDRRRADEYHQRALRLLRQRQK